MPIGLVRTSWAGTTGGPGVTQLFVQKGTSFGVLNAVDAQAAVNAVRAFWNSLATYLPDEILLTISPIVDQYEIISGQLESTVAAAAPPPSVVGQSTTNYAMASGMKASLVTGTVRNGRRVRGGIYIVPASAAIYSATGNVGSAIRTAVNTAGTQLMSALGTAGLQLVVYSRPFEGTASVPARGGAVALVTAFDTTEKGAILRGRRD